MAGVFPPSLRAGTKIRSAMRGPEVVIVPRGLEPFRIVPPYVQCG